MIYLITTTTWFMNWFNCFNLYCFNVYYFRSRLNCFMDSDLFYGFNFYDFSRRTSLSIMNFSYCSYFSRYFSFCSYFSFSSYFSYCSYFSFSCWSWSFRRGLADLSDGNRNFRRRCRCRFNFSWWWWCGGRFFTSISYGVEGSWSFNCSRCSSNFLWNKKKRERKWIIIN